jgi:hypothetical protein
MVERQCGHNMTLPTTSQVYGVRDSRVNESVRMSLELLEGGEVTNVTQAVLRAVTYFFSDNWGEIQFAAVVRKVAAATTFNA